MPALAAAEGSSLPWATAITASYGPTTPKLTPPNASVRDLTSSQSIPDAGLETCVAGAARTAGAVNVVRTIPTASTVLAQSRRRFTLHPPSWLSYWQVAVSHQPLGHSTPNLRDGQVAAGPRRYRNVGPQAA